MSGVTGKLGRGISSDSLVITLVLLLPSYMILLSHLITLTNKMGIILFAL